MGKHRSRKKKFKNQQKHPKLYKFAGYDLNTTGNGDAIILPIKQWDDYDRNLFHHIALRFISQ
jgi:hypothetical protein